MCIFYSLITHRLLLFKYQNPNLVSQKTKQKGFLEMLVTEKYEHEKHEHVQQSILSWGSFGPSVFGTAQVL